MEAAQGCQRRIHRRFARHTLLAAVSGTAPRMQCGHMHMTHFGATNERCAGVAVVAARLSRFPVCAFVCCVCLCVLVCHAAHLNIYCCTFPRQRLQHTLASTASTSSFSSSIRRCTSSLNLSPPPRPPPLNVTSHRAALVARASTSPPSLPPFSAAAACRHFLQQQHTAISGSRDAGRTG